MSPRRKSYPIGARLTEAELIADPYPAYAALLAHEPVSWVECLDMWWVTGYRDVFEILMDQTNYVTESGKSPISDTFGPQMLSVEGADHQRYKNGARPPLAPVNVRETMEKKIVAHTDALIDSIFSRKKAELRSEFASRLPIRVMLSLFGMPESDEGFLRSSYDSFESALANFTRNDAIRTAAQNTVAAFHERLRDLIDAERVRNSNTLFGHLIRLNGASALDEGEIQRNASIILFGGISTIEALILNTVWTLSTHPDVLARVKTDFEILPRVIEEVMRWQSPVQSATRYATRDIEFRGHKFKKGETVNCMLAAANRDPSVFPDPSRFDIDRSAMPRHLGFATGPHVCIGLHLARSEARIALQRLYERLPGLRMKQGPQATPQGYEFRKPETLSMVWD